MYSENRETAAEEEGSDAQHIIRVTQQSKQNQTNDIHRRKEKWRLREQNTK